MRFVLTLGRSLQTDPIGYADGLNWYAYVDNDPINQTDPTGKQAYNCSEGESSKSCWGQGGDDDGWRSMGRNEYEGRFGGTHGQSCGHSCRAAQAENRAAKDQFDDDYGDYFLCAAICAVGAPELLASGLSAAGLLKACNCFEAGTLVAVADGFKPIEEVQIGDLVLSRDDVTGEKAFKPVAALIPGKKRMIWDVVVESKAPNGEIRRETIHTTEEHPFRTSDAAWTPAAQLKAGASILTADLELATVAQVRKTGRIVRTYNVEVSDFHTYFVGHSSLWVHNACLLPTDKLPALRHRLSYRRCGTVPHKRERLSRRYERVLVSENSPLEWTVRPKGQQDHAGCSQLAGRFPLQRLLAPLGRTSKCPL